MSFVGNRDVDNVILNLLNDYDLYHTCQTSKEMFALCQQNSTNYNKLIHVQNIIDTVQDYLKIKDHLHISNLRLDVDLKSLLPKLNPVFDFVYPVMKIDMFIGKGGEILIHSYKKKEYMDLSMDANPRQITDFLIRLSLINHSIFKMILETVTEYKREKNKKRSSKKRY